MDKQIAPQQEYVSPPGIVAGQRPIPVALRKEPPALPAEVDAVVAKLEARAPGYGITFTPESPFVASDLGLILEAATLLRRYAQAVALFEQRDSERNRVARESGVTETPEWAQGFDDGYVSGVQLNPVIEDVTAALKQAVAEKEAEIASLRRGDETDRLTFEKVRSERNAAEKKLKAVEALCAEAESVCDDEPTMDYPGVLASELRKILREEH